MDKKQYFFMSVFENILKVNETNVMIIYDVDGNILFKFKDLLKSIGYTSKIKQLETVKIDKNNVFAYENLKVPHYNGVPFHNFQKKTKFINETGLYELLSSSNKPIAKQFMDKYFKEIMPEIRKNGKYILDQKSKTELKKNK